MPSLLRPDRENRRAANKTRVDAWVSSLIESDRDHGRSQDDFTVPQFAAAVNAMAPAMKAKGFDTYQGHGNVFYVKYDGAGDPVVVQARPLAERTVRPKFVGGTHA